MVKLIDHDGNTHNLSPAIKIDWGHNPAEFDWATIVEHEVIALGVALANKRSVLETLKEIESV